MLTQHMISALVDTADSIAAQNPYEVLKSLKELLGTNFEKKQGLEKDLAYARLIFNTELKEGDRINFKDNVWEVSEVNLIEDYVNLSRIDKIAHWSDKEILQPEMSALEKAVQKANEQKRKLTISEKEQIIFDNDERKEKIDIRTYRRENYFRFDLREVVKVQVSLLQAEQNYIDPHKVETVS